MIQYRTANASDMDNIIDFINMVFSMLRVPHNFEAMLPKVYSKEHALAEAHVLAEEDGRLCGCLGMYVFPLRVGAETLHVGYLGSMAVHPRVRGKGTMGELMRQQIARGKEMGLDMMVLGGQRQRYQYSGFETCGATYTYSISRANVRHALAEMDAAGIAFRRMEAADVPFSFDLYDQQMVGGARREDNFIATLQSYHRKAWVIEKGGALKGYLCATADGQSISEIVTESSEVVLPAIKAWTNAESIRLLHVDAAPYDTELNGLLAPICEGYSISPNCMLRVLKPKRVIQAYMSLKNSYETLRDGNLVLAWQGLGVFRIEVSPTKIQVECTDQEPDMVLSGIEAHQLLFGYNRFAVKNVHEKKLENWFPLPFYIPQPDSF